jgi:ring-1,2-phenylacetyl-CoA epoxidase subunit PaaD
MDAAFLPGFVMVTTATLVENDIRTLLDEVVDPDLPFLTIADIGILRGVAADDSRGVTVDITPTYSGCPAMEAITEDIVSVLTDHGYGPIEVEISHLPAWSSDWMSADAKRKLHENRIAPPSPLGVVAEVLCPMCASPAARTVSEFGSTACKSLMVCTSCREPFDMFKAI